MTGEVDNPFVRKLSYGAELTEADKAVLAEVSSGGRRMPVRSDIIAEGDRPTHSHLIMEGYACRYKILPDGRRQIMAIFVPGDVCDLHIQILGQMDHSIGTLSEVLIVDIAPATIADLTLNPRINRALWWMTLVDEGTLREWLVSMGQRPAPEQMAHVFSELILRLQSIGLASENTFPLPGTQEDLADLMGVTPVHANRTLGTLREMGLIELLGRTIRVPDLGRLHAFGGFDPNYLHLADGRKGQRGGMLEEPVVH